MRLDGAAAVLDRALQNAIAAAVTGNQSPFEAACTTLDEAGSGEQVRRVLAAVVRPALEAHHRDGVDGDALGELIEVVVGTSGWYPSLDPLALAIVLTGAFGIDIAARDDLPHPVSDAQLSRHAVLLVAHLAPRPAAVRRWLDLGWAEIAREDTND